MSYRVDPSTLLFNDLSVGEREVLYSQLRELVLKGTTVYGTEGFKAWCDAAGFDDRQSLLVMATAYPQRALLSLLEHAPVA